MPWEGAPRSPFASPRPWQLGRDATALNRVGNDRGTQYRHGIYPHTDAQAEAAARAIARCQASLDAPVVTEVQRAAVFWPAEAYHRMPSRSSNPVRYTCCRTHALLPFSMQSGTSKRAARALRSSARCQSGVTVKRDNATSAYSTYKYK